MVESRNSGPVLPLPVFGAAERERKALPDDSTILEVLGNVLFKDCKLDPCDCDFEVRDRVAYIHGNAGDMAQKRAVGKAVLAIPGMRAIVNELRIAPLAPRSDQIIAADVRSALAQAGFAPTSLTIKVQDSVVNISGEVSSEDARRTIDELVWSVRGTEDVVNDTNVKSSRPRPDKDIRRDIELTLNRSLGDQCQSVRADIKSGIVYLRGEVDSENKKFAAEDALRWIPRVIDVVNELAVTPLMSS